MQSYYWVKTFHLLFVVAWMAAVFYLPRILVNLSETAGQLPVTERLQLMGLRLYKFGHMMFGLALILGLVLWLGYKVIPDFPTMVAPVRPAGCTPSWAWWCCCWCITPGPGGC